MNHSLVNLDTGFEVLFCLVCLSPFLNATFANKANREEISGT